MREVIGETAGKIWRALGEKGEANVAMLPKLLKEKSELVYQGLGWLAHEDKVMYFKKSDKNFVKLTNPELEIFKTVH